ncbi:MAG TPA: hypothetical protein VHZ51_15350 [Ktedonobacteraceae bacterium]|jgi:hypothetical protein|nr:hypothetical protein [Ktedonobacteraceae bacterium]
MIIGKIVKSDSHINYVCQINGPHEADDQPAPADYAFGNFVRVAVRSGSTDDPEVTQIEMHNRQKAPTTCAIGVIYDTILFNPTYGSLGPRLSNEAQIEVFSPDYLSEKAIMVYILLLGTMEMAPVHEPASAISAVKQGVPLWSLELGSEIATLNDAEVQAFHFFSDHADEQPSLHMGYLSQITAQRGSLLPMVTLHIIDQLERLFPQNLALLSIVKRNFAWRLKVETAG